MTPTILLGGNLVLLGAFVVLFLLLMLRPREHSGELVDKAVQEDLRAGREEAARASRELRAELAGNLAANTETLRKTLGETVQLQRTQLDGVTAQLMKLTETNQAAVEQLRAAVTLQMQRIQDTSDKKLEEMRAELAGNLTANSETLTKTLGETVQLQRAQLEGVTAQLQKLTETNQAAVEQLRAAVTVQLQQIQESSEKKLEEMRVTVDEKLQVTLQSRLGESFKLVSAQLEAVHRGLGEMQNLAAGVGDLKRVLSNIKTRGLWGEIQLGAILEQVLSAEQYGCNVFVSGDSREVVEFAVKLPGLDDHPDSCVWLPIDSKFPQEDYLRLVEATGAADQTAIQAATKELVNRACLEAKQIHDKYICPPATTDFAVMFLPTEGLFAEIIRQPGLVEELQRKYRVVVAGPTTLIALLNSLRMGFRTLAIQKRASEVWKVLAAVKSEFARFGGTLDKVKKQLQTVSNSIEDTGKRSRAIERKLREVEELPAGAQEAVLPLSLDDDEDGEAPPTSDGIT